MKKNYMLDRPDCSYMLNRLRNTTGYKGEKPIRNLQQNGTLDSISISRDHIRKIRRATSITLLIELKLSITLLNGLKLVMLQVVQNTELVLHSAASPRY